MKKLSIIIPAYNEEKTILTLLERVNAQAIAGVEMEIVVVDDGSKDGTAALLDANPALYSKFVKLERNQGKGAAVIAALAAASGDYILFQDADLEYDPAEYPVMCEPALVHGADIVMGSRFVAPRMTRVAYLWNKVGNRMITLVFNVLNNTTFTDIYSCYLMFRRDATASGSSTISSPISAAAPSSSAPASATSRSTCATTSIPSIWSNRRRTCSRACAAASITCRVWH
jgi:glycosyltransferase involved in cell wall biosynthesis